MTRQNVENTSQMMNMQQQAELNLLIRELTDSMTELHQRMNFQ